MQVTFQELLRKQRIQKAQNGKRGGDCSSYYYYYLENLDSLISTENKHRTDYEKAITVFPDFCVLDLVF